MEEPTPQPIAAPQPTQTPAPAPVEPESMIEQAVKATARLEAANAELKALLDRQEKQRALDIMGGRAPAGIQPVQPKPETPKEYKDRVMRGDFNARDHRV